MSLETYHVEEPELLFGDNKRSVDVKTGLLVFGPYYLPEDKKPRPSEIRIGIIGDGDTIAKAKLWIEKCRGYIEGKSDNPYLFPSFPGITKAFKCELIAPSKLLKIM